MKTKINLNIPTSLVLNCEEAKLIIYDEPRAIIFNSNFSVLPKDRTIHTFTGDFSFDKAAWFNVWVKVEGKWKIVFGAVPKVTDSPLGEQMIDIDDKPIIKEAPKITQYSANFANNILGANVVSSTEPTLKQMAGSLGSSVAGWAKSGFAMASDETLELRLSICKTCEFWDASGFAGTGKCQKCGCSTQAKLRMATSVCPLDPPKWKAEV